MKILRSGQWTERSQLSFEVEGREHGVELSVIVEDMPTGGGPRLHKHPYGEAWVICGGKAEFSDGTRTETVGTGDMIFVGPDSPHKFRSVGDEPLKMVCVHGAGKFSTQWLES